MGSRDWEQSLVGRLMWLRTVVRHHLPGCDTAEDVVQEILASALTQPPGSANGPRGEDWHRWLRGLALNKVRMYRRSLGRRKHHEESAALQRPEEGSADGSPLSVILKAERAGLLRDAMARLSAVDQQILHWKYVDGWDYARIAHRLGVNRHAVTHRLREARDHLRAEARLLLPEDES